jgi:hypothetical protein
MKKTGNDAVRSLLQQGSFCSPTGHVRYLLDKDGSRDATSRPPNISTASMEIPLSAPLFRSRVTLFLVVFQDGLCYSQPDNRFSLDHPTPHLSFQSRYVHLIGDPGHTEHDCDLELVAVIAGARRVSDMDIPASVLEASHKYFPLISRV